MSEGSKKPPAFASYDLGTRTTPQVPIPPNMNSKQARAEYRQQLEAEFLRAMPGVEQLLEENTETPTEIRGAGGRAYRYRSFGCLLPGHEPRRSAILLLEHSHFERAIFFVIGCNCATLAWETPLDPPGTLKQAILHSCEMVFLTIFTAEMFVRVVAYGLVLHRSAYLRDPWCQLDVVTVVAGWLPIVFPELGNYTAFRAARTLRPLRALKMLPGMPLLVSWTLNIVPKLIGVVVLLALFLTAWGVVGMNVFRGVGAPFEQIGQTQFMLVHVITFNGWADTMYEVMSATSTSAWIYFVLVILLGGYMMMSLFFAVTFTEYCKLREGELNTRGATGSGNAKATRGSADEEGDTTKLLTGVESSSATGKDDEMPQVIGTPALFGASPGSNAKAFSPCAANIVSSNCFGVVTTALVLVNVVIMCLPYEGMPAKYWATLEEGVALLTVLFVIEMLLKLLAFGWREYFIDGWNCVDAFVVTTSLLEIGITVLIEAHGAHIEEHSGAVLNLSFLRVLRSFRAFRVLRLAKGWRGFYRIVSALARSGPHLVNVVILMMLTIFMLALVAMQLFGGIFTEENGYSSQRCPGGLCSNGLLEKPRLHFDYCLPAMISTFVLTTGQWASAASPILTIVGEGEGTFFIVVVFIGKCLLINFMVAALLYEFATSDGGEGQLQHSEERQHVLQTKEGLQRSEPASASAKELSGAQSAEWPHDFSLGCFAPRHPWRDVCTRVVHESLFQSTVMVCIVASTVCIAMESPTLDPASELGVTLSTLDMVFTCVFFLEMTIKVIASGFIFGEGAYLHSGWNQLDFVVVVASVMAILGEVSTELESLRVLRTLRVLRPLSLLSRDPGTRLLVSTLFESSASVFNALGILVALQVFFAILGMQLFSGRMASCSDPTSLTRIDCKLSPPPLPPPMPPPPPPISPPPVHPGDLPSEGRRLLWDVTAKPPTTALDVRWENPAFGSFDDFGSAMLLLYTMASADGWDVPMFVMMDATEPGVAPYRNDFSANALFSIVWMGLAYIFIGSLFVGAVVDAFGKLSGRENGSVTMTSEQYQWVCTMRSLANLRPSLGVAPPTNAIMRGLYELARSDGFDAFFMLAIVANIVLMACEYDGIEQDGVMFRLYQQATLGFLGLYYVEALISIAALGVKGYALDPWRQLDFTLLMMGTAYQFLPLFATALPLPPLALRILRSLNVLRITRVLRHVGVLRELMLTITSALPALLNATLLGCILVFMYAVLGQHLFAHLAHDPSSLDAGMNEVRNFETFGASMLLLIQVMTGDGWQHLMRDAKVDESSGYCSDDAGTCGTLAAIPFFVSFHIVASLILANLLIAVLVDMFATFSRYDRARVTSTDLTVFVDAWSEFDPDGTGLIVTDDLPRLLLKVPEPLGLKGSTITRANLLCLHLELHSNEEGTTLALRDVLVALVDHNYFRSDPELAERAAIPKLNLAAVAPVNESKHETRSPEVLLRRAPASAPTSAPAPAPLDVGEGDEPTAQQRLVWTIFRQAHVKIMLARMLRRARKRITARKQGLVAPTPLSPLVLYPRARASGSHLAEASNVSVPFAPVPASSPEREWRYKLQAESKWFPEQVEVPVDAAHVNMSGLSSKVSITSSPTKHGKPLLLHTAGEVPAYLIQRKAESPPRAPNKDHPKASWSGAERAESTRKGKRVVGRARSPGSASDRSLQHRLSVARKAHHDAAKVEPLNPIRPPSRRVSKETPSARRLTTPPREQSGGESNDPAVTARTDR